MTDTPTAGPLLPLPVLPLKNSVLLPYEFLPFARLNPGDLPLDSLDGLPDRIVANRLAVMAIHADRVELGEPVNLLKSHAEVAMELLRRGSRHAMRHSGRAASRCTP